MPPNKAKSPTAEKVIFRVFKHEGGVIALFPEIPGTNDPYTCQSYMHVGQHASADPNLLIRETRLAKPSEYRVLARELRQRGYRLKVIKRLRYVATDVRRKQIQAMRGNA